jgi:hypothetical protein
MGLRQRRLASLRAAGRDSNADPHYSFLLPYLLAGASCCADYARAGAGSQDSAYAAPGCPSRRPIRYQVSMSPLPLISIVPLGSRTNSSLRRS